MSKSVTPLESFTHLTDNLPSWLSKLDDLTAQVAEQNARFIRVSQFGEQLRKKKHNSTESLRPNDDDNITDAAIIPTDTYMPPTPSYKCLSHASRPKAAANNALVAAEIRRKRKPGSDHSHASGHARYRTKSMVVVYYDSAIQDAFESIVRSIAGARNNLRKGKTTASFKARMASLGMDETPFSSSPGDFAMLGPKMMKAGFSRSRLGLDLLNKNKTTCFEDADKDLETAQNLCEVGAHQFLRDGDCRLEIESMRKKFHNCLAVAKNEVERLQEEDAQETATEAETERQDPPKVEEKPEPVPVPVVDYIEEKVEPKIEPPPFKEISFTGTGTIEIDDGSDADSVHIDLSAFRRLRRA